MTVQIVDRDFTSYNEAIDGWLPAPVGASKADAAKQFAAAIELYQGRARTLLEMADRYTQDPAIPMELVEAARIASAADREHARRMTRHAASVAKTRK